MLLRKEITQTITPGVVKCCQGPADVENGLHWKKLYIMKRQKGRHYRKIPIL